MNCELTREQLSAFLDGELTRSEGEEVKGHLEGCAACREERDELEKLVSAVRAVPRLEAPPELRVLVREAVEADARQGTLGRVIRWAFPAEQGRTLLAAAVMFGVVVFAGIGIYLYGPGGPASKEAPLSPAAIRPSVDATSLRSAPARALPPMEGNEVALEEALAKDELRPEAEEPVDEAEEAEPSSGKAKKRQIFDQEAGEKGAELGNLTARKNDDSSLQDARVGSRGEPRLQAFTGDTPPPPPAATPVPSAPAAQGAGEGTAAPASAPEVRQRKSEAAPADRLEASRQHAEPDREAVMATESKALAREAGRGRIEEDAARDKKNEDVLYRFDSETGRFFRNGSSESAGTVASLELLRRSDVGGPLMRLLLPTGEETAGSDGDALSLGGEGFGEAWKEDPELEDLPAVSYEMQVTTCDPDSPSALGSNDNPIVVTENITPPVLQSGQAPLVAHALKGVVATFDMVVTREGRVARARLVSAPEMPSGLRVQVKWSVLRWEFVPARCGSVPVASRFRLQVQWR